MNPKYERYRNYARFKVVVTDPTLPTSDNTLPARTLERAALIFQHSVEPTQAAVLYASRTEDRDDWEVVDIRPAPPAN